MNLQTRDAIRNVVRAFIDHIKSSASSPLGDQRNQPNSVVDAEMLLVLLLPHAELGGEFSLASLFEAAHPDYAKILNDIADYKSSGKDLHRLVREKIVNLLVEFFSTHVEGKLPTFRIGSYGGYKGDDGPEIVDSYAMSLTLCIHVLRLYASWNDDAHQRGKTKPDVVWEELHNLASNRLTGAMRGLLSSFAVSRINRAEWQQSTDRVWPEDRMLPVRARLLQLGAEELLIGEAFECGWSWGPVREKNYINPRHDDKNNDDWSCRIRPFVLSAWPAYAAPYLYFTVMALDSIADLKGSEVMSGGLLEPEQLLLADRLRSLADVTSLYWATLAFGEREDSWPIENLPWITADEEGSDYWSLYVLRMVGDWLPGGDTGIGRIIDLLEELAQRSRITRRPFPANNDPAVVQIHAQGFQLDLEPDEEQQDEDSKHRIYEVYDFAPQMLKQAAQLLGLPLTDSHRTRLMRLIQGIWTHLTVRSSGGSMMSWDYPERCFDKVYFKEKDAEKSTSIDKKVRSWYFTERVMEALIALVKGEETRPKSSEQLRSVAAAALAEAEWRARDLRLSTDEHVNIAKRLSLARTQLDDDPLLALSIATDIGNKRLESITAKNVGK